MTDSNVVSLFTHRLHPVPDMPDRIEEIRGRVRAMPFRPALPMLSHSSLLRVSTLGGIAIAIFTAGYFAAELLLAVTL